MKHHPLDSPDSPDSPSARASSLALFASLLVGCVSTAPVEPPADPVVDPLVVDTAEGTLVGFDDGDAHAFLGVPYAAPPVGELRFRSPAPAEPWDEPRLSRSFSSPCPQPTGHFVAAPNTGVPYFGDEDCLYLNVWAPAERSPDEALPVMVFLHGGGNFIGSAHDPIDLAVGVEGGPPMYGGAKLSARGGTVVVTLNYRLGALGFLTEPSLAAETDSGASGNYGLMDQVAALEWVQRNIAAFGGDEDRVTLFGQSGGARDVLLLTASPLTEGLLDRAIIHSGPLNAQPAAQARMTSAALMAETGCGAAPDVAACLRAIPFEDLVLAEASQPLGLASGAFRPSVDGYVVPDQPLRRITAGLHQDVPIVIGTTETEYAHRWAGLAATHYPAAVAGAAGVEVAEDAMSVYPLSNFDTAHAAFATLMSDRNATCPNRRFVRAASPQATIYFYRFRRTLSTEHRLAFGPHHTSDLLFLFQHVDGEAFDADDADRAAAAQMLGYWTRFAHTGDPNGDGAPLWEPFRLGEEGYLSLDVVPRMEWELKPVECDFWDGTLSR